MGILKIIKNWLFPIKKVKVYNNTYTMSTSMAKRLDFRGMPIMTCHVCGKKTYEHNTKTWLRYCWQCETQHVKYDTMSRWW